MLAFEVCRCLLWLTKLASTNIANVHNWKASQEIDSCKLSCDYLFSKLLLFD